MWPFAKSRYELFESVDGRDPSPLVTNLRSGTGIAESGSMTLSPEPGNFLSQDVEIQGTLSFAKPLTVHGKVIGNVCSEGVLSIGATGVIEGDITAGSVAINGLMQGDVTVASRCELKGGGRLLGDVVAPRLIMEDGATLVGSCRIGPCAQQEAALRTKVA